jgi:hypothetical protein
MFRERMYLIIVKLLDKLHLIENKFERRRVK